MESNALATVIFGEQGNDNDYMLTAGDRIAFSIMLPFFSPNVSAVGSYDNGSYDLSSCNNLYTANADSSMGVFYSFNSECLTQMNIALNHKEDDDIDQILMNYSKGIEYSSLGLTFRQDIAKKTIGGKEASDGDSFLIDYNAPLTTVVAVVVLLLLISFCLDVALRSLKLALLQLIAPIPIISYIDPKSGKDGLFKKWYTMCFSTYLSLFVRLLALYFGIYIISLVGKMQMYDVVDNSLIDDPIVYIFIIIGALMFAKQLPKILEGLGLKLDGGNGSFSLNPFKKIEKDALGGKQLIQGAKGVAATTAAAGLAGAVNIGSRLADTNRWAARDKDGNIIKDANGRNKVTFKSAAKNVVGALGSGIAGTASATFRGTGKAIKGEKMGKIFADSYGEAMFAKLQREDLHRKGSTTIGVAASKFHQLTGTLDAAQRQTLEYGELENNHKTVVDNLKKQQEILNRNRDADLKPYKTIESSMKRINDMISARKNVKDAQERVDDLKRTNSYYVKAGDIKLDDHGNAIISSVDKDGNIIYARYTASDEANRMLSYQAKVADKNLATERSATYLDLKSHNTEVQNLINDVVESNAELYSRMNAEVNSLTKNAGETDAQFESRKDAVKTKWKKLMTRVEAQDDSGNIQFNKAGMYASSDNVSEVKYGYDVQEQIINEQIQQADADFERKLEKAGLDKNSRKWAANEADHAAAPVPKGGQPSNFMPSPSASGSSASYGQTRVFPGRPRSGGPGPGNP